MAVLPLASIASCCSRVGSPTATEGLDAAKPLGWRVTRPPASDPYARVQC